MAIASIQASRVASVTGGGKSVTPPGDFSTNTNSSVVGEVVLFANTLGKLGKRPGTLTGIATLVSGKLGARTDNSTNWDAAYVERRSWDGGSMNLNASLGRTNLGLGTASLNQTNDFEVPLSFQQSLARVSNTVTLVGDVALPGLSMYYGTDAGGVRGFFVLPTPSGGGAVSSVFTRTGAVVAVAGDYATFYEAVLGNPAVSGYILSSTTTGVRSWIVPPSAPVSSVFTRTGAIVALAGDYAVFYQPVGSYEVPLTFSQSLSRVTNTVTLSGDAATPGASKYYGTNAASTKGYFSLPVGASYASLQTAALTPTGTAVAAGQMMGLGVGNTITPTASGKILVTIAGGIVNTSTGGAVAAIRWGTGTPPANLAAPTGTQVGGTANRSNIGANQTVPFSLSAVVTGLTLGTPVWFDVILQCSPTVGASGISLVTVSAVELP